MKKTLSLIIAICLIFSLTAQTVFAAIAVPMAEDALEKTLDEPTPEMMEAMIKKVRPLITVPEEYKNFSWDFRSGYKTSEPSWYFSWSGDKGEISAECDTEGRIFGYYTYDYQSERKTVLPNVSPDELLPVALDFVNKTAPHLSKLDLRLEGTSTGSIFYGHTYTYNFTRYENDIPVPQNNMSVSVNYITKEVTSFSSNISLGLDFANTNSDIGAGKAKEVLSEVQEMSLSYRLKTEYDDDGNLISQKAYLVYTPTLSYVSVDANSGKVYTERNTWEEYRFNSSATGGIMMDSAAKEEAADSENGGYQLTEEELEQLAVLESLISKDEAVKTVLEDKDLYIPENAYVENARLSKTRYDVKPLGDNGEKEEKYTWNLYFLTPGESYLGANAVVDAHNGKLISYNAELPYVYHYTEFDIEIPEIRISKDEAVGIASEFIKRHEPEKAESVVFSNEGAYSPMKYVENADGSTTPIYRASRLSFVRQNEGVDFTYNSFRVGVDYATGKITSYNLTWFDDVEFESPKDAISAKNALMALYENNGFGINYEINRNYTYIDGVVNSTSYETYTRAVYSLYAPESSVVRALDGKLIDYSGEEITSDGFTGEYNDISGHWAEDTINRFVWIGYGPEGDKFNPNENITGKDFVSLCETLRIYGDSEEIMKAESLLRMDAVRLIIDYLGYGKIAALKNVFITDFADNSDFSDNDIGYAAIARGFGLIEGDGENFRPYDVLTRAEAVTIAENVIELGLID